MMSAILLLAYTGRSLWLDTDTADAGPAPSLSTQPQSGNLPPPTNALDRAAGLDRLLAYARSLEEKSYQSGGDHPGEGFDCSGFVYHVYREEMGLRLPRSSRGMSRVGLLVDLSEIEPGDLLFFTGSNSDSDAIGHVSLVLQVAPHSIQMIHSSSSQGIVVQDLFEMPYYLERFRWARRPYQN